MTVIHVSDNITDFKNVNTCQMQLSQKGLPWNGLPPTLLSLAAIDQGLLEGSLLQSPVGLEYVGRVQE